MESFYLDDVRREIEREWRELDRLRRQNPKPKAQVKAQQATIEQLENQPWMT